MAEKLRKFTFNGGGGPTGKYPWDEWADGSIWQITRGVDFTCRFESMRVSMHDQARNRGKRVHTAVVGENLVFQFYDRQPS